MGVRLTTEQFIYKSIKIHGNKYDYSLVNYVNAHTKVDIICKIHGVFSQTPNDNLSNKGCFLCRGDRISKSKRDTKSEFIKKAILVHGSRYDYSLVDYINQESKVKIKCDIHGVFEQSPNGHLAKKGCCKCGRDSTEKSAKENPTGWSTTQWQKSGERSKCFDSFKVYIIKCYNEDEEFYKIGRTFRKTNIRFRVGLPYHYEIIKELIFDTAKEAFDKETELKRINRKYKYRPIILFKGQNECFSKVIIQWN